MEYFLIEFKAEYYCQGYEWGTFQRLVKAFNYKAAIERIRITETKDFDNHTAKDFKNLTIA